MIAANGLAAALIMNYGVLLGVLLLLCLDAAADQQEKDEDDDQGSQNDSKYLSSIQFKVNVSAIRSIDVDRQLELIMVIIESGHEVPHKCVA